MPNTGPARAFVVMRNKGASKQEKSIYKLTILSLMISNSILSIILSLETSNPILSIILPLMISDPSL